ncbi:MAG: hypothetical protein NTY48_03785, partial [Candidatus Diapherotrites archaeon]|nr:hypothetical protein [Candidatus Diapherotrites archaeon]
FDEKILGGEDDQEPDIIKDEPKIATKKQSQTQGFASSGNQSGSSFLAQSFSASADGLNIRQTSPKMNYAKQGLAQSVSVSKGSFSNQTTQSLQPKSLGGHGGIMESNTEWEELWKKGIVTAVNAKLAEIKIIKESIDSELGQKVDEAVRKELYQFKVLMDSQKDLLISTNKEALEDKQKEIAFIIDSKIAELRQYNKQLGDNLAVIDASKRQQEYALSQISLALDEARKTKSQLVIEVNSEMIKSKSGAQAFLDSASNQLAQMDERISKTLELEKNIAEGMLVAAEQKIETLTIQRADELIGALQVELNKLQAVSKSVSPEVLEQKIAVLEEFKKQFLNSMQENLTQINSAIIDLNNRNAAAEKALAEKSLAIDAKLEELTKFEKNFVSLLDKAVNKK